MAHYNIVLLTYLLTYNHVQAIFGKTRLQQCSFCVTFLVLENNKCSPWRCTWSWTTFWLCWPVVYEIHLSYCKYRGFEIRPALKWGRLGQDAAGGRLIVNVVCVVWFTRWLCRGVSMRVREGYGGAGWSSTWVGCLWLSIVSCPTFVLRLCRRWVTPD